MSYLVPSEFVTKTVDAGESKIFMFTRDTVIRAYMVGAILALAAVFAVTVNEQTGYPIIGAILAPVGFCMLYLLGFDLLTGVFVLTPLVLIFPLVFEHSVVNRFFFPSALLMGGNFSVMDYIICNEIPTVQGNLVGGLTFTGLTRYATHVCTGATRRVTASA
jgi:formate/nitrite transporter FocA (FNT family)